MSGKGGAAGSSSSSAVPPAPAPPPRPAGTPSPTSEALPDDVFDAIASDVVLMPPSSKVNRKFLSRAEVDECKTWFTAKLGADLTNDRVYEYMARRLAVLLAHSGTSPDMDAEEMSVVVKKMDGTEKVFLVGAFISWLQGKGWLRRFARTELADYAYEGAKHNGQVYPAAAKFGVTGVGRNVAFDFADGITAKLSRQEIRSRVQLFRAALARSSKSEEIADVSWRDSGFGGSEAI